VKEEEFDRIAAMETEPENLTPFKVLKSAAGFYIGRNIIHGKGFEEPYSRCTGYFETELEAECEFELKFDGNGLKNK
jgi:hypothetical protein